MNKTQMKKYLLGLYKRDAGLYLGVKDGGPSSGLYKKDKGLYLETTNHDKITYEARLRLLENIMIEMFHFRVVRVKDTTTVYSNFQEKKKLYSWKGLC